MEINKHLPSKMPEKSQMYNLYSITTEQKNTKEVWGLIQSKPITRKNNI